MEESLDDLLLQLEKSSSDLKKQQQSPAAAANTPKTRSSTTTTKTYTTDSREPVEVSSTRWTSSSKTTTTNSTQNGNDARTNGSTSPYTYQTADTVDQARRLPAAAAAAQNGYSSVSKLSSQHRIVNNNNNADGGDAERDPIMYPNNPVTPVITSYREQHGKKASSPTNYNNNNDHYATVGGGGAEREFSPSLSYTTTNSSRLSSNNEVVDTGRYANNNSNSNSNRQQRDAYTAPSSTARTTTTRSSPLTSSAAARASSTSATTTTTTRGGGGVPSNATRALDELMQSFGTQHAASPTATRERRSPSVADGPREVPRPYNELSETKLEHHESDAELFDMRGKSPTPPRERPSRMTSSPSSRGSSNTLPYVASRQQQQQQQQQVVYQPIERTAKGTGVSYNDSRYMTTSPPSERSASRDRADFVGTTRPVTLNSLSSTRSRPLGNVVRRDLSPTNNIKSYEHISMTTTRTRTPEDEENDSRRSPVAGGVRVLPSSPVQPQSILKRSPTPTRDTVNRRIAGLNTEKTTSYGDIGRPRSAALSDNEAEDGEYEKVREYQYERRHVTETTKTTQAQVEPSSSSARKSTIAVQEKPTPRARTNRPSANEVQRISTSTTRTSTTTNNNADDQNDTSFENHHIQPASILRNSAVYTGGSSSSSKTCSECGKPAATIRGGDADPDNPFVTALGRLWHIQCFACNECGTVLNNVPFFERQQKLWCEHDYLQHFSPKCAQCSEAIIGQCVTALGSQQFHPNCFQCNDCKKALLGGGGGGGGGATGYVEDEGTALCNVCYDERYGKKCRGCNSTIRGGTSYVESLGAAWHDECFRCHMCDDPINRGAGGAAALHELDGKPVCERDYYSRFNATCAACRQPITGRCITAMGKKFHPDHFCCSYCKRELNRGLFKELEGVPWCHPCWEKVFCPEDQVVIDKRATQAMPLAPLAALNRNSPARF